MDESIELEETKITQTFSPSEMDHLPKQGYFTKGGRPGPGRTPRPKVEIKTDPTNPMDCLRELILDKDYRERTLIRMRDGKLPKEIELFLNQRFYGMPPMEQRTTKKVSPDKLTNTQLQEAIESLADINEDEPKIRAVK